MVSAESTNGNVRVYVDPTSEITDDERYVYLVTSLVIHSVSP